MSTAAARKQLADALKPELGKRFSIFPDPEKSTDVVTRPTLFLIRTQVARVPGNPRLGAHTHTFALWVVLPQNRGEDALDEALDEVIDALEDVAGSSWDTADRDVWGDSNPAYRISMTTHSTRKEAN